MFINGIESCAYQDTNSTVFALLPFFKHSQLVSKNQKDKFLNLLHSIVSLALIGLKEFKKGNFNQFDAQIGENLCQIRAYHITFLARKYLQDSSQESLFQSKIDFLADYQKAIEASIDHWNHAVRTSSKYNKHLDGNETVNEFLEKNSLFIELHDDIVYLASCFFLAHFSTKVNGILQSISLEAIGCELNNSKSQAKKLVQAFQNNICRLGLDFVQYLLNSLPQLAHYKKILPELIKESGDSRLVLPCFVASEIIFYHALSTQTPILLSVHRVGAQIKEEEIIYFVMIGGYLAKYSLFDQKEYVLSACMVIEAEVNYRTNEEIESVEEYIHRLLKANPIQALLANTAMHPQYAGSQLHHLTHDPFITVLNPGDKRIAEQSFNSMRQFATEWGCHKENSLTLFMKHAYSNSLQKQIHSLQYGYKVYDAHQALNQNPFSTQYQGIYRPYEQSQC